MLDATPLLRAYAARRLGEVARLDPVATQRAQLLGLLRRAQATRFGRAHDMASIGDVAAYQRRVKLRRWEDFWAEYWQPAFPRLSDVSWPGTIPHFANTSGTTGAATKRIPVSHAMMRSNRRAALDVLSFHIAARPHSHVLAGRNLVLGGTAAMEPLAPGIDAGDLSGLVAANMPWWARPRAFPPLSVALINDWTRKVDTLAPMSLSANITSVSGTPSWLLPFFERVARLRPGARLAGLYPNLELIVHGGVGFAPYRARFAEWLEGSAALLREVYPASEGFFAIADRGDGQGLRLVLDNGLFFEFVRPGDLCSDNPDRRWIADAEIGTDYALIISSNAGLWSYVLGDTVTLIERSPPRVLVTGRTSWMLSVAGEHLIGHELDLGMAAAALAVGSRVVEYAAGAVGPDAADHRVGHVFVVELDRPADMARFAQALDAEFARLNEDYAAHRQGDFSLRPPRVVAAPPGTFAGWMQGRGKLGGQNKVPRVIGEAGLLASLLETAGG